MSAKLFKSDILFLERILAVSGFYKGPLNGQWTDAVDAAEEALLATYEQIKQTLGAFDDRTESNIKSLIPAAQKKAREFMKAASEFPLTCRIISGTRTYAEQDELYKIGRTVKKDHPKVTNAKGGQSNHNFGIAWDVGIFDGKKYYEGGKKKPKEEKAYVDLSKIIKGKVAGLEWGGDWKNPVDRPHYQLVTNKSESQIRALLEKGQPYVV
jgi:peptidoglycan L-alanyl-D-glutamate endopeptidase CwlK